MSYQEMANFLANFKASLYNQNQIGSDKQLIASAYESLSTITLTIEEKKIIIDNLAIFSKEDINIELYLRFLKTSLGFVCNYSLQTIMNVIKKVHDAYLNNNVTSFIKELSNLKFAAAVVLTKKDYQEFIKRIETDSPDNINICYIFNTYNKIRSKISPESKLFWDIFFGQEYLAFLIKSNIPLNEVIKPQKNRKTNKEPIKPVQLDLFTYQEVETKEPSFNTLNCYQIVDLYNQSRKPIIKEEKSKNDFFEQNSIIENSIILPKLKKSHNYLYNQD